MSPTETRMAPAQTARPPMPLSVILPNFNHGNVIARALSALLAQTPAAREIIVVDDGSTDDSVEIVEAMQRRHQSIRLIRNKTNQGIIASVKTALAVATGDYLLFAAIRRFRAARPVQSCAGWSDRISASRLLLCRCCAGRRGLPGDRVTSGDRAAIRWWLSVAGGRAPCDPGNRFLGAGDQHRLPPAIAGRYRIFRRASGFARRCPGQSASRFSPRLLFRSRGAGGL